MLPGPRVLSALALACASCTLIFNTNDLPEPVDAAEIDAEEIDAPIDAAIDAVDADTTVFQLETVTPNVLHEGMGTGGSRPVVLWLTANVLVDNATVSFAWEPADLANPVTSITVAANGTRRELAVSLIVPEIEGFNEGMTRTLRVTVNAGDGTDSIDVMVRGHNRLMVTGTISADDPVYDTQKHSSILVSGAVTAAASMKRLRLAAYGSIEITAAITAPAPRLGGCAGGGPGLPANCPPSGGGAGASSTLNPGGGGGGGGFGTNGTPGTDSGGTGGAPGGNPMLVPIELVTGLAVNRGGGGGGGGAGLLGALGGAGGHGGGAVYLEADGAIIVGANGRIIVNGSSGVTGPSNGFGGGGSGGAILVRAGAPLAYPTASPVGWLSATGAPAAGNGGAGGAGRIRLDDPAHNVTGAATPAAAEAPQWDLASVPVIVRSPMLTLTGRGPDACFAVVPAPTSPLDICGLTTDRRLNPAGTPITFTLTAGANHLCLGWAATTVYVPTQTRPEASNCVDVTYVP